jgi:hypothetical protein
MVELQQSFGDFVLTNVLDRGPHHTIALGVQALTGKKCRLYVFESAAARVQEPARVRSAVADPRILDVLGAGIVPAPWIALEVATGEDLAAYVRATGPLSLPSAREVLREICETLRSLHDAGLAHGSLRPDVVWFDQKPGKHMIVRIGEVAFVAGRPQDDVLALAHTAFFVLVGQPPPAGQTAAASALARALHSPQPLTPTFDAWFARATQADPVLRFASARECESALLYALDDLPRPAPDIQQVALDASSPYRARGGVAEPVANAVQPPRPARLRLGFLLALLAACLVAVVVIVGIRRPHGTPGVAGIRAKRGTIPDALRPAVTIPAHFGPVFRLAMMPEGNTAVSLGADDTIKFWNVTTGAQERVLSPSFGRAGALTVTRGGLVAAAGAGVVKVWSLGAEPKLTLTIPAHDAQVTGLAITADGSVLVTSSFDGTLRSWQLPGGKMLHEMKGHRGRVLSLALSPDDERVFSSGDDGTVRGWSMKTGASLVTIAAHQHPISCVKIANDGQTLATASDDGTVKMFHADSGTLLRTLEVSGTEVWTLAFTPLGRSIAIGDKDGLIYMYSVLSGERLRVLSGHESGTLALVYSADGETLVSGGADRIIRVWKHFD